MDSHKIIVKLYAQTDTFAPSEFVPVFHRWIQTHALPGYTLIDVADYAHVPNGPGSLVVSSEANIHMDRGDGRLGVMYVRKLPLPGATTFRDRLRATLGETLEAAAKLEQEESLHGRLKFRTDEIVIRVNDRLLAPNTPETYAALKDDIQAVAKDAFGGRAVALEHNPAPQSLFEVRVKGNESAPIATVLARLGATPVGAA